MILGKREGIVNGEEAVKGNEANEEDVIRKNKCKQISRKEQTCRSRWWSKECTVALPVT